MKLDEQVCEIELARRLQHLEVKQEGVLFWHSPMLAPSWHLSWSAGEKDMCYCPHHYTAFTVAELFEILPSHINVQELEPFNNYWLQVNKRRAKNIQYIINYHCDTHDWTEGHFIMRKLFEHNIYDENLANALAKTLICLIEKKYKNIT